MWHAVSSRRVSKVNDGELIFIFSIFHGCAVGDSRAIFRILSIQSMLNFVVFDNLAEAYGNRRRVQLPFCVFFFSSFCRLSFVFHNAIHIRFLLAFFLCVAKQGFGTVLDGKKT